LAVGLIIAAPVGPVNVLCIQRTLEKGWKSGILSGLGAAVADTVYGGIAGFSISLVIEFLIREEVWIRLIGGVLTATGLVLFMIAILVPGRRRAAADAAFVPAE
jgi:threonine/homoserine/homoserine lactone efflux protein